MHIDLKSEDLKTSSTSTSTSTTPLATPLPQLNQYLHGGIPPSTLTELYGSKSTFKTQFILTLSVKTALNKQVAIIVDSDSTTHTLRLLQIAYSLASSPQVAHEAMTRIHIIPVVDWCDFTALVHLLPSVIQQTNTSFLAIDSMSTLFRTCVESAPSKRLEATAAKLRHIAVDSNLYIVLTNGARSDDHFSATSQSTMGEVWKHVIGTRLYLHRHRDSSGLVRVIKTGICIQSQQASVHFHVNEKGITED